MQKSDLRFEILRLFKILLQFQTMQRNPPVVFRTKTRCLKTINKVNEGGDEIRTPPIRGIYAFPSFERHSVA